MHSPVVIKSSHDGTSLEFSEFSGDHFSATLRGPDFHGIGCIYAYEPSQLATFFRDLAAHWRGWSGKKEWRSLEGELSLVAACDSTGHTSLAVRLRSGPDPFDWNLTAVLLIDAGQLESVAKLIEGFLIAA